MILWRTFLVATLLTIATVAEAGNDNILHLTNNNGLSSNSVNALYQDSRGLLWIGTWDGLNSYDGAMVRTFRPDFTRNDGLSNPVVRRIFEDDSGMMWIATDYGINRYNCYENRFDNYYLAYENKPIYREHAFDVCRSDSDCIIAMSYNSGLYYFDAAANQFVKVDMPSSLPAVGISQIFFDINNRLWIIYDELMVCCDVENTAGKVLLKRMGEVQHAAMQQVVYDRHRRIWCTDAAGEMSYVDVDECRKAVRVEDVPMTIYDVLWCDGIYYCGTDNGLYAFDEEREVSHRFAGLAVMSVLQSTQGILWAGSDARGLFGIIPQERSFVSYTPEVMPQLGFYPVRAFLKDDNGSLWVGTKGGGLLNATLNADGRASVKSYTTAHGMPDNSVFALCAMPQGDFWIGCDGRRGLCYYSQQHRKIIEPVYVGSQPLPVISSVYAISQPCDSVLWVGTSGNGLFRLHIARQAGRYVIKEYNHYSFGRRAGSLSSNIIYSLAWQADTSLWIATRGGGLNRLNPATGEVRIYKNNPLCDNSLSCNDVICAYVGSQGDVWAGTTNGLNRLTLAQGDTAFVRMGENNGLSNNNIHAIVEDDNGNVWVSTNRGISRIETTNYTMVHYYYDDGLQGNEFADGAALAVHGGTELYFGGTNGFTHFHPSQLVASTYKPAIYLSAFNVNNEPRPLQQNYNKPVKLHYTENSLDLHFSIIEFVANNKCRMSYRLLRDHGTEVSWISIGDSREIVLSNLVPGSYKLEVSYTNSDNNLYEAAFSFPFVITPPWWLSGYAYAGYALVVLCAIVLLLMRQRRKIMRRHQRLIQEMERAREGEIHEAKLRFFTNIAHEFSNSIALIYGPCERIISNGEIDDTSRNYLKTIRRNAERMQRLIQQLMDFRKAETGHLSMCFEETDVSEIVKYTLDNFTERAEDKKMHISIDMPAQPILWAVDRDAMEKIVFNLLSNAFKYAPDGGKVALRLAVDDDKLVFACMNDGKMINPDDQRAIFNRFKVLDNFETKLSQGIFTRNGIGLAMCKDLATLMNGSIAVESNEAGETTFTVVINRNEPTKTNLPASPEVFPIAYASNPTGKSVMVVDDQPEMCAFIGEILSPKYSVVSAQDAGEALAMLQNHQPDIIVSDVVMPGMDGIALLKELKHNDKTRHIPVILLTSRATVESRVQGLEEGADMYIGKPFHPSYLLASIDRILGNKDMMREYMQSPQAYAEQYNGVVMDRLDKEFVDKLVDVLQRNLANEEFSLEMLANEMAVSRVQLYRKIKQLTRQTPSEFVRNYRLQEAEKLLRITSYTVAEVMTRCGFQNKSYFYREFAKVYDATPKEYRKLRAGDAKNS